MIKIFRVIPIIYFIFIHTAFSNETDIISEIQIDGVQRIDVETINAYAEIEIGEIYSDEIGNSILKKLFETDLFLILKYLFLITNYTFL